jgi:hypothetical protein
MIDPTVKKLRVSLEAELSICENDDQHALDIREAEYVQRAISPTIAGHLRNITTASSPADLSSTFSRAVVSDQRCTGDDSIETPSHFDRQTSGFSPRIWTFQQASHVSV